ncbi:CaiB/BaiF CoA transferase family protein [Pseudomonas lundensis]|uniref:CaiB/BaiF CoA transferase family protein n=1 Tax=Pseudomonas lundensis TaxID=86185 RepID=UPI000642726B|nr:CoA transferase [Pseudomonas lundensis]AOZ11284.1 CoA transferase [Pseudomonas lundensis]QVQ77667.1 CoA transferase [Pseudomonas lundensis]QVQ83263.1 CoA transferase [Pseudomonas lundensis]
MSNSPFTQQLQGVRVLDISRVLAGPHCTAMLADLGADVIKFEVPQEGDDARHLGPFLAGESVYFGLINRGKRSVEIDFKDPSDRQRFYELVADADVLVENFRPGVTRRLGIDFDTLKQHNPRLIYASISGFGQDGPLSGRPAYDIVAQAMSGLMSVTGFAATGPTRSGESIGDLCAGVYAAWAISSALFARERHAPGAQYIDVAMFDVLFSLQMTGLSNLYANGVAPGLVGNRHPVSTPFDTYRAADGLVVIAVASNRLFERLCQCMGQPELAIDPRFIDDASRTRHEPQLRAAIEAWTAQHSVEHLCDGLLEAGVPSSPVWDLAEAASSEHARVRQLQFQPPGAAVPCVPQPVFFNGRKPRALTAAPRLGADNAIFGLNPTGVNP